MNRDEENFYDTYSSEEDEEEGIIKENEKLSKNLDIFKNKLHDCLDKNTEDVQTKYQSYENIIKMNLPEDQAFEKMIKEAKLTKEEINFFKRMTQNLNKEESKSQIENDPKYTVYNKMRQMNMPEPVIRQKMALEKKLTKEEIELFFRSSKPAPSNPSSEISNIEETKKSIAPQTEIEKEKKDIIPEGSFWTKQKKYTFDFDTDIQETKKVEQVLKIEKKIVSKLEQDIEKFLKGPLKSLSKKLYNTIDYQKLYEKIYSIITNINGEELKRLDINTQSTIKESIIPVILGLLKKYEEFKDIINSILSKETKDSLGDVENFILFFFNKNNQLINIIQINDSKTEFNNTYLNIGSKFDTLINSYNTINKYRDIIGEFITAIKICYDKLKKKKKAPEYYSFDDISRNILPSENKKFMSIFYSWIQRKNADTEFKLFFSDEFLDMITTLSTMNKIDAEITISMWNDFKPNYKIYKDLFTKMYSYIKTLEPESEPYYKKIKSYVENENEEIVVYETVFKELSSKLKTITELSKNIIKYFGEKYSDKGNIDDIVLNTILLICKQYSIEMNKEMIKNKKVLIDQGHRRTKSKERRSRSRKIRRTKSKVRRSRSRKIRRTKNKVRISRSRKIRRTKSKVRISRSRKIRRTKSKVRRS